jgi:hypothetical protein
MDLDQPDQVPCCGDTIRVPNNIELYKINALRPLVAVGSPLIHYGLGGPHFLFPTYGNFSNMRRCSAR